MNNHSPKTIIFFSLHYPFHFSDSYLDDEFNLLSSKFDKKIVVTTNTFTNEKRPTPNGTVVYRYNPHTHGVTVISILSLLFKPFFYTEVFNLLFKYKLGLSMPLLKEVFAFYSRAYYMKKFVERVIHEQEVDTNGLLIYSYWMLEGSFAAAMLRTTLPNVKVVARAHSLDVYFDRSTVGYHPFRRYIVGQLNRLYFISANARTYFINKHFLAKSNIAKTAVSRIGFSAGNKYIGTVVSDVLRVISVGYVQKLKRIDLIVDALALLDITVEWTHVGHSNHNAQDFEDIQAYAQKLLGAKANITFRFTGKTDKADLFALYEQKPFDVFLNVSETEGIPVSMMESMSYSVPVIGTNVGGVAEIVEEAKNGFLLSPYPDSKEVSSALMRFYKLSNDDRNHMRMAAYTTWYTQYNAQVNNQNFTNEVVALLD